MSADKYLDEIYRVLDKVRSSQIVNIRKAAAMIVHTAVSGKSIYAFGCSHAGILAEELFYRSGGFAIINPIMPPGLTLDVRPITLTSQMERLDGYGKVIADSVPFASGDLLILHSVSGRNNVPVDVAIAAREHGVRVISLTSLEYSKKVPSRHPSGKKLFEVSDLVLDNCGEYGDAAVKIDGLPEKVAPTSTAIGAVILNAIVAEAAQLFMDMGEVPPVFASANTEGGDEHNRIVMEKYREKIRYI